MKTLAPLAALALALPAAAQWTQATPATSPSARERPAMTFDVGQSHTLMFGGTTGFSLLGDTWTYDGTTWTQQSPGSAPSARAFASMAHDITRGRTVLYSGADTTGPWGPGVASDETWEWDGSNWNKLGPTNTPGGLSRSAMAFDLGRQRVVLYGGNQDMTFPIATAGTWEWDGTNWTTITGATQPGPLEGAAMCYHTALGKTILFGGINPQIGGNNTTWAYDGTGWTALNIAGAVPAARVDPHMEFDLSRGVAVMSGGMDFTNGNIMTDTWEFDGAGWTQVSTGAPALKWGGSSLDLANGTFVVFGGVNGSFSQKNETWEYRAPVGASYTLFGTGCAGSAGIPTLVPQGVPAMGTTFQLDVINLPGSAGVAYMVIGFSDTVWNGTPLPMSLAGFGLGSCTGYISVDQGQILISAAGVASFARFVPIDPALAGLKFFNQAVSFDPAAGNTAGAVVSNAGAGVIQ